MITPQDMEGLYQTIQEAGAPLGLRDFGSYALNVMRIEKGYHGWGSDFGTEYTPFDAGLERFIAFGKPEFVGRDAVLARRETPSEWCFTGFEIEGGDADALPSDPILQDGEVVGYVTSAAFGCPDRQAGWRSAILNAPGWDADKPFEIEILGDRRKALCRDPHLYDPDNNRLKG